jgi:uncharacterized protein YdeI (YjbR/CyaY-like superfamily)
VSSNPSFFPTPKEFRIWLTANHASEQELIVGYYKISSAKPSLTWEESVIEALCFGWIDGIRRRIDTESYTVRFTPRRPKSNWSIKNIASAERLIKTGRMQSAGLLAFPARSDSNSASHSFEQDQELQLSNDFIDQFKALDQAWNFFQSQPPGYQRTIIHWVMSAKRETTQQRRSNRLLQVSNQEIRVDLLSPFGKSQKS